jgi:hypothetical protein
MSRKATLRLVEPGPEPSGPPTTLELIEALNAPGRLNDQPAIKRLLANRAARHPRLALVENGDDSA